MATHCAECREVIRTANGASSEGRAKALILVLAPLIRETILLIRDFI